MSKHKTITRIFIFKCKYVDKALTCARSLHLASNASTLMLIGRGLEARLFDTLSGYALIGEVCGPWISMVQ